MLKEKGVCDVFFSFYRVSTDTRGFLTIGVCYVIFLGLWGRLQSKDGLGDGLVGSYNASLKGFQGSPGVRGFDP